MCIKITVETVIWLIPTFPIKHKSESNRGLWFPIRIVKPTKSRTTKTGKQRDVLLDYICLSKQSHGEGFIAIYSLRALSDSSRPQRVHSSIWFCRLLEKKLHPNCRVGLKKHHFKSFVVSHLCFWNRRLQYLSELMLEILGRHLFNFDRSWKCLSNTQKRSMRSQSTTQRWCIILSGMFFWIFQLHLRLKFGLTKIYGFHCSGFYILW